MKKWLLLLAFCFLAFGCTQVSPEDGVCGNGIIEGLEECDETGFSEVCTEFLEEPAECFSCECYLRGANGGSFGGPEGGEPPKIKEPPEPEQKEPEVPPPPIQDFEESCFEQSTRMSHPDGTFYDATCCTQTSDCEEGSICDLTSTACLGKGPGSCGVCIERAPSIEDKAKCAEEEVCGDGKDNDCDYIVDNPDQCISECPSFGLSGDMELVDEKTVRFVRDSGASIGMISFSESRKFSKDSQLLLTIQAEDETTKDNIKMRTLVSGTFLGLYDLAGDFDGSIPTEITSLPLTTEDFRMGATLFNTLRIESTKEGPSILITLESCPE